MLTLILLLEENSGSEIIHQSLLMPLTQWCLERSQMLACWHNNMGLGPACPCILRDLLYSGFIAWDQNVSFSSFHCCSIRMSAGELFYILTHYSGPHGTGEIKCMTPLKCCFSILSSSWNILPTINNTVKERPFSISGFYSIVDSAVILKYCN